MDDSNDQPLQPEPTKPSRFLGCFGFSSRKKPAVLEKNRSVKMKKKRFISWPAKQSAIKTVPFDTTHSTVSDQKLVTDTKSKKKKRCKTLDHKVSSNSKKTGEIPASENSVADHEESKHRPQEITGEVEEKIITENRDSTSSDQMKSPKKTNNTHHKQFFRKIDAIRAGQSQPGSPNARPKSNRPSSFSRSTTVAATNHPKPVRDKSFDKLKTTHKETEEMNNNKFEPVIGMSIIMVTLVIMLFWGRLCAILCTSAWFYFIPRFRTGSDPNMNRASILGEPDFDSEEYKKRVVLEGLLERNHRFVN